MWLRSGGVVVRHVVWLSDHDHDLLMISCQDVPWQACQLLTKQHTAACAPQHPCQLPEQWPSTAQQLSLTLFCPPPRTCISNHLQPVCSSPTYSSTKVKGEMPPGRVHTMPLPLGCSRK